MSLIELMLNDKWETIQKHVESVAAKIIMEKINNKKAEIIAKINNEINTFVSFT